MKKIQEIIKEFQEFKIETPRQLARQLLFRIGEHMERDTNDPIKLRILNRDPNISLMDLIEIIGEYSLSLTFNKTTNIMRDIYDDEYGTYLDIAIKYLHDYDIASAIAAEYCDNEDRKNSFLNVFISEDSNSTGDVVQFTKMVKLIQDNERKINSPK